MDYIGNKYKKYKYKKLLNKALLCFELNANFSILTC